MRNQISSQLMHILTHEEKYMLSSHLSYLERALENGGKDVLLTISNDEERIVGFSEIDPNKDLDRFERFANDEFTCEILSIKSIWVAIEHVFRYKDTGSNIDNVETNNVKSVYLLAVISELHFIKEISLGKSAEIISAECFGPYYNLIRICKTIWSIIYAYDLIKEIPTENSLDCQHRETLKKHFFTCFHNPSRWINELKQLLENIIGKLNDTNNTEREFEVQTIEDFIVFLEDLFQDESNISDRTAYEIVDMINNTIADIDRTLDALPIHHDNNRHTLKVKRSALMELCIDIEETYKTN